MTPPEKALGVRLGLRDALSQLRAGAERSDPSRTYRVGLACSFTPLHLETFVLAYIERKRPGTTVHAVSGIYGDLPGSLDQVFEAGVDSCVALVEWFDLDPRLGWRDAVAAPVADIDDMTRTARRRLERIAPRLQALGRQCPTALVLPGLDLPAVYASDANRVGPLRARLNVMLAEFAAGLVDAPGLRVLAPGAIVPPGVPSVAPGDLRSDIRSGFPYSVAHASQIARVAVEVLLPAPTKKGLITDLDDTLWRGLVGEIGPEAVSWDLDSGSLVHALYQQLLTGLTGRGVLLAVASKNEPEVVQAALRRADLLISADMIYPVTASWSPKSRAVGEILRAWNIEASDVVFVDDSPMELAEVAAKYPEITTVPFPTGDANGVAAMLKQLAGFFWRDQVTEEDSLRLSSLRSSAELEQAMTSAEDERAFLRDLGGRITIGTGGWEQPRARELVNKTNQFNLNGRRFDEVQWRELCTRSGSVVWTVSYQDRFGQLGVISVLAGVRRPGSITVDCWVLSCRAFSRALEHHILRSLCQTYDPDRIDLDFVPTKRNGVVSALLDAVAAAEHCGRRRLDCRALRDDQSANIHGTQHDADDE